MNNARSPEDASAVSAKSRALEAAAEALRCNRPADVERILGGLLATSPRDADALRFLGQAQQRRGDHAAAAATLHKALRSRPDDALILNDLGNSLRSRGDLDGAISAFRAATEQSSAFKAAWYNLGTALNANSQPELAKPAFERALDCDPAFAEARGALGDVLKHLGDTDSAVACYRKCLEVRSYAPHAWFQLANLKTLQLSVDDLAALRRWSVEASLGDKDRVFIGYALSKALEDQREHGSAFAALSGASRLARRYMTWDAAAFSKQVSAVDAAFTQTPAGTDDSGLGREVVFLVSMPRAGSTLIEQILSAHPEVEGAGELPDLGAVLVDESKRRGREFPGWVAEATATDWRRLGEDYLRRTQRWRRPGMRVTDKTPGNWTLVGAAAAMLPAARFINCRRDPLETALSCYRQLFAFGNYFSYDLDELGAYWRDHDRLSSAWRERYPDCFLEQVYEELLVDPENQIRRLLDFLGLPFDPACLDFHRSGRIVRTFSAEQVRQPLQRNTARAHLYGSALEPLRAALLGAAAADRP